MGQSFEKLKKKTLLAAILKSVIVGLSLGIFVVGVLLLAFKLGKVDFTRTLNIPILGSINFFWALLIPVGLGVALIAGGICIAFMLPTDKKIAVKYDAEFGLNEKLQTMVEFAHVESDMHTLQREDALERLNNAPSPKVRFSRIWYFLLIAIIAVAIFFTGLILPRATQKGTGSNPPAGGPPELPTVDPDAFDYSLEMQTKMDDLVNFVRESALEEDFRREVVDRLVALNKTLIETETKTAMLAEVTGAVQYIDDLIYSTNSFLTLSNEMAEVDPELSKGIKQGFISYKGKVMDGMTENYVKTLGLEIGDYIESTMEDYVTASFTALMVSQTPLDGSKNLKDALTEYTASLDGALTISVIDETDALYDSFNKLYRSLRTIRGMITQPATTADSILWSRMKENFGIYRTNAVAALRVQSFKCIMEVFVRQWLEDLFNVSIPLNELYAEIVYTPGDAPGTGDGTGDGSGSGSGGGGVGDGEQKFGTTEKTYDPIADKQVQLSSEILKKYEQAIGSGNLTPEMEQFLSAYLYYLNTGTGKTKN
ncbi:MAG: hypothetical protein K2K04_03935 [Clostridia bacterium]|nr:hypothetical protein [Clostridia bacterium]